MSGMVESRRCMILERLEVNPLQLTETIDILVKFLDRLLASYTFEIRSPLSVTLFTLLIKPPLVPGGEPGLVKVCLDPTFGGCPLVVGHGRMPGPVVPPSPPARLLNTHSV